MSLYNDNQSNDSNNNNDDDDTVGWDSQNSIHEYHYISPMHDHDPPSTRFYYRHRQGILYISDTAGTPHNNEVAAAAAATSLSSISLSMGLLSPMDALNLNSPIQKPNHHDITMREEKCETPNEPSRSGMKRRDYQSQDADDHQAEKRYRREPKVISAIAEDEASEGSLQDSSYDDALNTWSEGYNGIFHPPSSSHLHTRPSSLRPIPFMPPSNTGSSSALHASLECFPAVTPSDPDPQHVLSADDPNEPSQPSSAMIEGTDSSSEQQRRSHGLPTTSNLGAMSSPIWISDDDDEPVSSSVEKIGERLQLPDTSSSIQQQDDQVNSQPSASVITTAPKAQRRRRRRNVNAPTIAPPNRPRRSIQRTPTSVLLNQRPYHRWTDEEVTALDKGFKRYGDNWVRIKSEYPIIANQTNAQLRQKIKKIAQKQG